jgi:hypothetical protein
LNALNNRENQTTEANTKILNKKKKPEELHLNKQDFKKQKRLETYGL